ncbi:MAG: cysteine desulfurase [Clostridiales bacterium]|nr:cysteine desulfurase [Clostridiales bacterium]
MREVYLDNSATTQVTPGVAAVMQEVLTETYGNPSSLHRKGVAAERVITSARRVLAGACAVKEGEIYFTSGGTEANNTVIKGVARRRRRRGTHLITTKIEHPSVLYAYRALEEEGFQVTYLDVDREGLVHPEKVIAALREDTILVSVMHVNNEVGSVQPVAEIGKRLKTANKEILFHVDAVQSFGKLPVLPGNWQADLISFSAHKIHGPKGVGAFYCKGGVLLEPLLHGGDQEKGFRPGTENTAGIAGFAEAAQIAVQKQEENNRLMANLRQRMLAGIMEAIPDVFYNGQAGAAPHILSVTISGIKGEVLVHALEEHGIYISTGSACHSHRADPSHVLLAMGRAEKEIEASLRFSFSPYNTEEEIDYTLEKLRDNAANLRLFTRR